jgi:hypothetical protein
VINTLGATPSSTILEWRRNNTGGWTTLVSATSSITYTHSLTDSNFNTQAFNYRYSVIDSVGATASATKDITPGSYVAPTAPLTLTGPSASSPETNVLREKGNVSTTITGTVTRNSINVALSSYTLQYQVNGSGGWTNVNGTQSIGPGNTAITSTNHNDVALITSTSLLYRIVIVDAYQTTTLGSTTVAFQNAIFYGPSASVPTNSAGVRVLGTRVLTGSVNPFNLLTGNTYTIFTVAMPATLSLTSVIDLDALNADITASYVLSSFNVNDYGGTAVSYRIYTMTNGSPYSSSHRHQITRA